MDHRMYCFFIFVTFMFVGMFSNMRGSFGLAAIFFTLAVLTALMGMGVSDAKTR